MTAGLYIHIPFCVKKCNYCDFYSIGGGDTVSDRYVDAVIREIKKYPHKTTIKSHKKAIFVLKI